MPGPSEKTDTISADETWDKDGSPYQITGDITTSSGVVISVEAGVEIDVQKRGGKITLGDSSKFIFGGTKDAPIHVHGQVGQKHFWLGFVHASDSFLEGRYTTFEDASVLFDHNQGGDDWFEHCIFRSNGVVFDTDSTVAPPRILWRKNLFKSNNCVIRGDLKVLPYLGVDLIDSEVEEYVVDNDFTENAWVFIIDAITADFIAKRNRFYRNSRGVLHILSGVTAGSMKLEDNWFGSDSGPEESTGNPSGTGDLILNEGTMTPDYTPWLTLGKYVPVLDDAREFANRILREGTPSGEEVATALLEDDELERMIDRAEAIVDSWISEGPFREKRFLGYGSETQEMHDVPAGGKYMETLYRPIIAVTTVEARSGSASWDTVNEDETGGWYASEEDKRRGRIRVDCSHTYEKDSFRVTYTHGHYDAPEEIRDAVIKLTTLQIFHAILQAGEDDPYANRVQALERQIEELRKRLETKKKRYVVV